MPSIKELQRYKDIQRCEEFERIKFYGKLLNIVKLDESYIFKIYDGSAPASFRVYTDQDLLACYQNYELYLFEGYVGMGKRKYFKMERASLVPYSKELERTYYPERFKVLSDEMKNVYFLHLNKIKDDGIRYLVGLCLGVPVKGLSNSPGLQRVQDIYISSFASIARHDSYQGGLVAHISGMLLQVEALEKVFGDSSVYQPEQMSGINWDILRAIVYLHDCGKPATYQKLQNGRVSWKDEMKLDHATMGVCYVYNRWVSCKDKVSEETAQKILYGIANHMNDKATGLLELEIFRNLDKVDAICADTSKWI